MTVQAAPMVYNNGRIYKCIYHDLISQSDEPHLECDLDMSIIP